MSFPSKLAGQDQGTLTDLRLRELSLLIPKSVLLFFRQDLKKKKEQKTFNMWIEEQVERKQ